MGIDDLISINKNGRVSYSGWIEWEHIPTGFSHLSSRLFGIR